MKNLHQESFDVLRDLCEDRSGKVDSSVITLNYLNDANFGDFNIKRQGLCLHLLARETNKLGFEAHTSSETWVRPHFDD